MADSNGSQTLSSQKESRNNVTDTPVTDPASSTKVGQIILTIKSFYLLSKLLF